MTGTIGTTGDGGVTGEEGVGVGGTAGVGPEEPPPMIDEVVMATQDEPGQANCSQP